ncbi:MAG: nucleoside phosphorylase [Minisyncoccia bacterium]
MELKASAPTTIDNRQYHLHTAPGSIAPLCLLVGDPDRATLIAKELLRHSRLVGDHRGFKSYTGMYRGKPVSVVTTGIGSPSLCTVVPEAYDSGARLFVRVGTCGSLIPESQLGDMIIVDRALRFESTSRNYAHAAFPAVADPRIVAALTDAAKRFCPARYFVGTEATTDCFREGQGRPNTEGVLTARAWANHNNAIIGGAVCYSMEASALFVWCATHFGGIPCGAINAVIGNRITNTWGVKGERKAAVIALEAAWSLRHIV